MTTQQNRVSEISRRTVLRTAAVTTATGSIFASTASAVGPKDFQVNFCGCSQVCAVKTEANDNVPIASITVFIAEETADGWEFSVNVYDDSSDLPLCDTTGEEESKKIIAVAPSEEAVFPNQVCLVCNPGQCAAKALDAYKEAYEDETGSTIECMNTSNGTPEFGQFDDLTCAGDDYTIDVVRGGCGQPGRTPGNPDQPRGKP